MLTPEQVPDIPALLDAETARRIKSWPQNSNRASSAGHPCVRYLVLCRTAGELRELHGLPLQRIYDEGNLHEDALMREMEEAGLRIVEQQRPYEWKKFQITGRIDGRLAVNGNDLIPLEIKSSSPNIFRAILNMAPTDMLASRYLWIRKYPAQILLYMLMEGSSMGIMVFKNKTTGEKCQKLFILDEAMLEYAESVLKKLEAVNAHVAAGTVPDAKFIDECKGCPFAKTACFVGRDYGPGIDIADDPEIETKLSRREELQSARDEYEDLDKEIKERYRGRIAVVGDWMIESKPYETTAYDVPKEIKGQYAVKKQAFRTSIERL